LNIGSLFRREFRLGKNGEENGGKNRDNRDDDE